MLKKLFVVVLTLILAFPIGAVSAESMNKAEKMNEKQVNKYLEKAGFPQTLIDSWPLSVKRDWVERGVTKYEGQVSKYYNKDKETGKLKLVKVVDTSKGEQVESQASIPTTDMVFRITKAASGATSWGVQNEIEWLNPEYWMLPEDTLGTSWSSNMRAYGNTFSCYEYYKDAYGNWQDDPGQCGGQPYDGSQSGVAWKIDFYNGFDGYKAYSLQTVYVSDGSSSGTASIYSKYAHDQSSDYAIGVSFGWLTITYSSAGDFDQAFHQIDWKY
jgi:hypothetical protein